MGLCIGWTRRPSPTDAGSELEALTLLETHKDRITHQLGCMASSAMSYGVGPIGGVAAARKQAKVTNLGSLSNTPPVAAKPAVGPHKARLAHRAYTRPHLMALVVALALIGCGGSESTDASQDTGTTQTTGADLSTDSSGSDPSVPVPGSSEGDSGEVDLPGEPFDGFFRDGDTVVVYGVAYDDVLNIRELPDPSADIVATAAATEQDLVATGEARQSVGGIWYQVTIDEVDGWANGAYLGFLGVTDDATSEFVGGGDLPVTATMQELGELIAGFYSTDDPESKVVQSIGNSAGDLYEIGYDVVGLGDDASLGYRLHVFAAEIEGGGGFGLKSIERTEFCGRGVSEGLCV